MSRRATATILSALLIAAPASTQTLPSVPAEAPASVPVSPVEDSVQLVMLALLGDRITLPVSIGGQGPYRFILDTGSERTVVSHELARTLDLAAGRRVVLTTITGRTPAATVIVPTIAIDALAATGSIEAPALDAIDLGAAGLIGLDTLAGRAVSIDFDARSMVVRDARRRAPARPKPDEIIVRARSLLGQLILTEARLGSQRVDVILDTGTGVSIGNLALQRAIAGRRGMLRRIELTSVTGEQIGADYHAVPQLSVGGITFRDIPIAFLDAAPFRRLGLDRRPAILLGMDAMRLFRQVDIDFANRAVTFRLPADLRRRGAPPGL
ncbi:aspartyl protease family protein [Sphingomonas japonica]|uniref:Aspartyl protease n=1 Tax=Sphingomonas japonica TaxID=511662 RepID=A0ABX0TZ62_9SPHN|nr:aspartyl protease family protein [Sphingomonas japonica]NIJ23518.1 putative aspartyl protease [Sphingomonas japonica]